MSILPWTPESFLSSFVIQPSRYSNCYVKISLTRKNVNIKSSHIIILIITLQHPQIMYTLESRNWRTYFGDTLCIGLNANSSTSPTLRFILNPDKPAPATPNNEPITAAPKILKNICQLWRKSTIFNTIFSSYFNLILVTCCTSDCDCCSPTKHTRHTSSCKSIIVVTQLWERTDKLPISGAASPPVRPSTAPPPKVASPTRAYRFIFRFLNRFLLSFDSSLLH
ncbi:hypothetical protein Ocin01_07987 [Orchesella cincta]|uniref:Uncharacterized protein n=1 Tax=Orchesella cincta TaxID=48709 RepID=A0A1D2N082_ORCCI|nr:hypothetical protein Ocin01_07987 [Orchesella cincta]